MEYPLDDQFYSGYGSVFEDLSAEEKTPTSILILKIIFCSFGLLGNLIVIFVILALKEYKDSVTNWYVLQLALSDLMFLCTIPIKMKEKADGKWPGSEALCKFNESLIFLNYNSSILFLTVMSFDRFLVICHNASSLSQTFRKRSSAYFATFIVWAVSLLCCTPIFMYCGVTYHKCTCEFAKQKTPEDECISMGMQYDLENCVDNLTGATYPGNYVDEKPKYENLVGSGKHDDFRQNVPGRNNETELPLPDGLPFECSYQNESTSWIAFIYFNFIVLFIVPFVIMTICYSLIVKMMVQSGTRKLSITSATIENTKQRIKTQKRKLTNSEKAYKKATRICVAYVVLFAICWLPFHSVHLAKISGIHQTNEVCHSISVISFLLVIAHSTINPCLYSIVGKTFSGRVRKAFSLLRGKSTSQVNLSSSTSGLVGQYLRRKSRGSKSHSSTAAAAANICQEKSEENELRDRPSADGLHFDAVSD